MERVAYQIRKLQNLLRRRGQSREDTEDLIQEAFLRLHVYCQSQEVQHQEAFLVQTVMNLAVDLHRKEHLHLYAKERPEELPLIDCRPTPDEDLAIQQRLNSVATALDSLGPRTREVFIMHLLEGYGCARIAEQFGISPNP